MATTMILAIAERQNKDVFEMKETPARRETQAPNSSNRSETADMGRPANGVGFSWTPRMLSNATTARPGQPTITAKRECARVSRHSMQATSAPPSSTAGSPTRHRRHGHEGPVRLLPAPAPLRPAPPPQSSVNGNVRLAADPPQRSAPQAAAAQTGRTTPRCGRLDPQDRLTQQAADSQQQHTAGAAPSSPSAYVQHPYRRRPTDLCTHTLAAAAEPAHASRSRPAALIVQPFRLWTMARSLSKWSVKTGLAAVPIRLLSDRTFPWHRTSGPTSSDLVSTRSGSYPAGVGVRLASDTRPDPAFN
ncbi:hypothetical protein BC831DRAFT_504375 [Entophlyctis helioformis]|nr:hypothetical protein BC831DRAFT_504375 [Entophlyctis helioformis]